MWDVKTDLREVVHTFADIPSDHSGCGNDVDSVVLVGVDIDDEGPEYGEEDGFVCHFSCSALCKVVF